VEENEVRLLTISENKGGITQITQTA
jgi:hypothetical protein